MPPTIPIPGNWLLDRLWPSIRQHPAIWFVLAVALLYGWYRLEQTAGADELRTVKAEVGRISSKVALLAARIQQKSLEDDLRAVNSDLFAIERDIARYREANERIPDLYTKQRADLAQRRESLQAQLHDFLRINGELLR